MRVLMVADVPPNPDSGASGTEFQTAVALRNRGHDVECVWAADLPHWIKHGNLHSLIEQPLGYRRVVLARGVGRGFDVVHANQPHGYLAARALAGRTGAPVFVHRSHGFEPRVLEALRPWSLGGQGSSMRRVARTLMATLLEGNNRGIAKYADGHIVSSSLCAEYLIRRYAVARDTVATIPQAPPPLFHDTHAVKPQGRRLSRMLYVGQFAFVKGPHVLARAFEQVLRRLPDSTLTWVCDKKDHREAASMLSDAARKQVTFMDWMTQESLIKVYDDHGIFLFPSLFEGFGKAFIEAMSRGLVVIATPEGGAIDLIVDGKNGRLVSTGDPDAMAGACESILADTASSEAMGEAARNTALLYTWDRVAVETADFYARLLERKSNWDHAA